VTRAPDYAELDPSCAHGADFDAPRSHVPACAQSGLPGWLFDLVA
jgi:hypothetical protein